MPGEQGFIFLTKHAVDDILKDVRGHSNNLEGAMPAILKALLGSCDGFSVTSSGLIKYLSHLHAWAGHISGVTPRPGTQIDICTLEGWDQSSYFFQRCTALIQLWVQLQKGSAEVDIQKASRFLAYELWVTANAFRVKQAYCRVQNSVSDKPDDTTQVTTVFSQDVLERLARILIEAIRQAALCETQQQDICCIPSGYQGHAVYLVFRGSWSGIAVRIDNLNANDLAAQEHPSIMEVNRENVKEYSRSKLIADCPIDQFGEESVVNAFAYYVVGVCQAKGMARAEALRHLYNQDDQYGLPRSGLSSDYSEMPQLKVGNCVVGNFCVGINIRSEHYLNLGKEPFHWICSEEAKWASDALFSQNQTIGIETKRRIQDAALQVKNVWSTDLPLIDEQHRIDQKDRKSLDETICAGLSKPDNRYVLMTGAVGSGITTELVRYARRHTKEYALIRYVDCAEAISHFSVVLSSFGVLTADWDAIPWEGDKQQLIDALSALAKDKNVTTFIQQVLAPLHTLLKDFAQDLNIVLPEHADVLAILRKIYQYLDSPDFLTDLLKRYQASANSPVSGKVLLIFDHMPNQGMFELLFPHGTSHSSLHVLVSSQDRNWGKHHQPHVPLDYPSKEDIDRYVRKEQLDAGKWVTAHECFPPNATSPFVIKSGIAALKRITAAKYKKRHPDVVTDSGINELLYIQQQLEQLYRVSPDARIILELSSCLNDHLPLVWLEDQKQDPDFPLAMSDSQKCIAALRTYRMIEESDAHPGFFKIPINVRETIRNDAQASQTHAQDHAQLILKGLKVILWVLKEKMTFFEVGEQRVFLLRSCVLHLETLMKGIGGTHTSLEQYAHLLNDICDITEQQDSRCSHVASMFALNLARSNEERARALYCLTRLSVDMGDYNQAWQYCSCYKDLLTHGFNPLITEVMRGNGDRLDASHPWCAYKKADILLKSGKSQGDVAVDISAQIEACAGETIAMKDRSKYTALAHRVLGEFYLVYKNDVAKAYEHLSTCREICFELLHGGQQVNQIRSIMASTLTSFGNACFLEQPANIAAATIFFITASEYQDDVYERHVVLCYRLAQCDVHSGVLDRVQAGLKQLNHVLTYPVFQYQQGSLSQELLRQLKPIYCLDLMLILFFCAQAYEQLKAYDFAVTHYHHALMCVDAIMDSMGSARQRKGEILAHLGRCCLQMEGKRKEARQYFNEAESYLSKPEQPLTFFCLASRRMVESGKRQLNSPQTAIAQSSEKAPCDASVSSGRSCKFTCDLMMIVMLCMGICLCGVLVSMLNRYQDSSVPSPVL